MTGHLLLDHQYSPESDPIASDWPDLQVIASHQFGRIDMHHAKQLLVVPNAEELFVDFYAQVHPFPHFILEMRWHWHPRNHSIGRVEIE